MKKIHCLQHVPFEGPGHIETWAASKGYSISYTRFYQNDPLPAEKDFDCLLVMGGPMGVYDEAAYPWLADEKKFIRESIGLQKKVLGICLGAQLIAEVCGARVYANPKKEIGWFPVAVTDSLQSYGIPASNMTVFHWHGDTFDLPPHAINHVTSAACKHQLFTIGQHVMGIQFHFEATAKTIQGMLENCGDELSVRDTYIQTKEEIARHYNHCKRSNEALDKILNSFIQNSFISN